MWRGIDNARTMLPYPSGSNLSCKEMVMSETGKERRIMGAMTIGCAAIALGGSVGLGVLEKKRTQEQVALAKSRGHVSK